MRWSAAWPLSASRTACTDQDSGGPSNQAMGTVLGAAVGGAVGGLAFGSVGGVVGGALVGALAGNLVGRALDNRSVRGSPRRRKAPSWPTPTCRPPTRSSRPTRPSSTPATVVAATAGRRRRPRRADGSTCRPIELTATKNGQTTTETTTFCQAAGSTDLKPVSV